MSNARILVVDDSPTIRRVIDQALSTAGHVVIQNANGASALQEAPHLDLDVMILDFLMPEMNGYQVIKSMIQDPILCDIPVILMCTRADDIPVEALSGLELLEILPKPFSPDDLREAVDTVLEKVGQYKKDDTTLILELPGESDSTAEKSDSTQSYSNPNPNENSPFEQNPTDIQPNASVATEIATSASPMVVLAGLLAEALNGRGISRAEELASSILQKVRTQVDDSGLHSFLGEIIDLKQLHQPLPCLYGDLAAIPLPEILQLLKLQGQTGIMQVSLNRARYELGFRKGRIIWIRARNIRGETRLGQYFLKEGVLTRLQLDELLEQTKTGLPLGQLLLTKRLAQPADIKNALRAQAQDLLYELLCAQRGVFGLRKLDGLPDAAPEELGFAVDDILFSALRRVNETRLFRRIVPNMDTCFRKIASATQTGLNGAELKVLDCLSSEDPISARALAVATSLTDEEIKKYLFRLAALDRIATADSTIEEDPRDKNADREANEVST